MKQGGGGNLSCWIVGQTDRFKAAVPENPVTNWTSFYGVSDIGPWFAVGELGGLPHEMLRLPGSDHTESILGKPGIRSAQNRALLDWMNKYVLGIEPDDNK